MKLKHFPLALLCTIALALSLPAADPFKFPTQYSAEMTMTAKGNKQIGKMYMNDDKVRMEVSAQGMEMISIMRMDKKVAYMLMVAMKKYMELPIDPQQNQMVNAMRDPNLKLEPLGKETLRGKVCDKYRLIVEGKTMLMWVESATQLPVRQAMENEDVVIDWDNFKVGPPAADLFEIPAGYEKMDMGGLKGLQMPQ